MSFDMHSTNNVYIIYYVHFALSLMSSYELNVPQSHILVGVDYYY